ncbi:MAG: endo-1,4-beta-xylanase [Oligoflexia bacterium]|nr:endo-1,4-beta-xylanase [Oligoflexia bacterium]
MATKSIRHARAIFKLPPGGPAATSVAYTCDHQGRPCHSRVTFGDGSAIVESTHHIFSLRLLWPVRGFGEVVLRTKVVRPRKQHYSLIALLIEGQAERVRLYSKDFAKQADTLAESGLGFVRSKQFQSAERILAKLLQLGEKAALVKARSLPKRNLEFGVQGFRIDTQQALISKLRRVANFVVLPSYFFMTRPTARRFDISRLKKLARVSRTQAKINVFKLHPLLWLHPAATPAWIKELGFNQLKPFVERHARKVLRHLPAGVRYIDICNELHSSDANGCSLTITQLVELAELVGKLVKQERPQLHTIINFSDIFGAGSGIGKTPSVPVEHFLDCCELAKVPYDGIGLQFYMGLKKEFTCRELLEISEKFDDLERFGKDLHLTELGFPSSWRVDAQSFFPTDHPAVGGYWHNPWDEKTQAEFLEALLTIFASKPHARSVCWWDISDAGTAQDVSSKFFPHAGLFRANSDPKRAWKVFANWSKRQPNSGGRGNRRS